jgi:solute carrier family 35 (UDP-sugar transporter), member A1/2/3
MAPTAWMAPTTLLLVGTAWVYSSILSKQSALSTSAQWCLALYACQVGLQPTLTKRYLHVSMDQRYCSLAEEIIKTLLAWILWQGQSPAVRATAWSTWTLSSSLAISALPSILYAIQGVWTYQAQQRLDAVTFNGVTQTKTVSAAAWCWILLGQSQTSRKWASLGVLTVAALVLEGHGWVFVQRLQALMGHTRKQSQKEPTSTQSSISTAPTPTWQQQQSLSGLLPCLGATFVSGLAGTLSQWGLQNAGGGGQGRNAYLFTMEISIYSGLWLAASLMWSRLMSTRNGSNKSAPKQPSKQQQLPPTTPRATVLIPIVTKAMGGLLTALIHKHAGTVAKGFGFVLGLVLSGLVKAWVEGALAPHQVMGTLLVLLSTWMHLAPVS